MISYCYYLIASLPELQPAGESPITVDGFWERCRTHLAERERHRLESVESHGISGEEPKLESLRKWNLHERALRNELAVLRAGRRGIEPGLHVRDHVPDPEAAAAAREAMQAGTPLEAEMKLDRRRWEFLDDLQALHHFDLDWLAIYLVKLHLLARRARFRADLGRPRLEETKSHAEELAGFAVRPSAHEINR